MGICICVPIYNDWNNATELAKEYLGSDLPSSHLHFVDNGSSQESSFDLTNLISSESNLKLTRLSENLGMGGGIAAGSRLCSEEWFMWMPGNMKVRPSDLVDFVASLLASDADVFVKARRSDRHTIARLKTAAASALQTLVAGVRMTDTGGTPSALRRAGKLWDSIEAAPKDYTFDSFMLLRAKLTGTPVFRPDVRYHLRLFGTSHWQRGLWTEVSLMLELIMQIRRWKLAWRQESKDMSEVRVG